MRIEPRLRANLLKLFDLYAVHQGFEKTTVGARMYGDARFYTNLKGGTIFSVRAYDKVVARFRASWPDGLAWPSDIEPVLIQEMPEAPRRKRRAAGA